MAQSQLPPKVPAMIQNWPSSAFQMMPTVAPASQNSWVDEFLDFSTVRRSAHRRSTSAPIAFVKAEECGNNNNTCDNGNGVFEGLDDEQLRLMFSDDVPAMGGAQTMSYSGPSTPSDQNSENQEKMGSTHPEVKLFPKSEPEEALDSSGKPLTQSPAALNPSGNAGADTVIDPKRIKRILANRQSAQRSRVRKLQYISELERSVTTLQTEVSALSPRVAFLDHQRLILNVDNSVLKQRIAALAQDKIFKDAHQEALRKEIEILRQICHEQHMKKAANEATQPQNASTPNSTQNIMDQEYCILLKEI